MADALYTHTLEVREREQEEQPASVNMVPWWYRDHSKMMVILFMFTTTI